MTTLSTLRILETAHKCIKVGSKEESEVRVLVNSLCNEFTNRMKSDTLFKETYNKTILCGSFRDSLKVLRADEVDFNIVLILPGVVTSGDYPGKVAININSYSGSSECQELLRKFANEDGFLQTSKLRAWSQSMVSKANKNDLEIINGHVLTIKISQNGPAETVYVTIKSPAPGSCLEQGFQLSIDLVLGIYFPPESLQTGSTSHNSKHGWVAIPKPINGSGDYQNILFVPSYPEQESEELKNKCNMKPAIRLVKQMRDRKGVKNLKSYFIKTIFLRINKEKGPEFWNRPLDEILVISLDYLVKSLEARSLPVHQHPKFNMLKKFNSNQIDAMKIQMGVALKQFHKYQNTTALYNLFFTEKQKISFIKEIAQQK